MPTPKVRDMRRCEYNRHTAGAMPLLLSIAIGSIGCAGAEKYHYDGNGSCVNEAGAEGMNRADRKQIIATLSAECVDLAGRDFSEEKEKWIDPDTDSPLKFEDVDFRGADLRDSVFPTYSGPTCSTQIQGADVRGARDAYNRGVAGEADAFTQYDADRCSMGHRGCGLDEAKLYCEPVAFGD